PPRIPRRCWRVRAGRRLPLPHENEPRPLATPARRAGSFLRPRRGPGFSAGPYRPRPCRRDRVLRVARSLQMIAAKTPLAPPAVPLAPRRELLLGKPTCRFLLRFARPPKDRAARLPNPDVPGRQHRDLAAARDAVVPSAH